MPDPAESALDLTQVEVVGEFTTDGGPYVDDHFLVLVRRDGSWTEIPFGEGREDAVIRALQAKFDPHLDVGALCNQTDFKSRVAYPKELRAQPLFIFIEKKLPIWRIVKRFGIGEAESHLSPEVAAYLRRLASVGPV